MAERAKPQHGRRLAMRPHRQLRAGRDIDDVALAAECRPRHRRQMARGFTRVGRRRDPGLKGRRRAPLREAGRQCCFQPPRHVGPIRDQHRQEHEHEQHTQSVRIALRQTQVRPGDAQIADTANDLQTMRPPKNAGVAGVSDGWMILKSRQRSMLEPARQFEMAQRLAARRHRRLAQRPDHRADDGAHEGDERRKMKPLGQRREHIGEREDQEHADDAARRPQSGPQALGRQHRPAQAHAYSDRSRQAVRLVGKIVFVELGRHSRPRIAVGISRSAKRACVPRPSWPQPSAAGGQRQSLRHVPEFPAPVAWHCSRMPKPRHRRRPSE